MTPAGVQTGYIDPGELRQNGHNESFHAVFCDRCFEPWLFPSVRETRAVSNGWLYEYNNEHPHRALYGLTLATFAARWALDRQLTTNVDNEDKIAAP